ncbi:Uu.00g046410.m01.CDS01 [Anthostomella pinea]|uniref:Uu.00g046410.m01.CDS01 n=1 Tax=Anthostomella pinea TaxID=933095 RepID=A0AAI8V6A8_9PEZI|nr:Uu.00g046410.m01.CDS01 [Anthostomella pinea]
MSFARKPSLLCWLCQSRAFSTSYRRLAEQATMITTTTTKPAKISTTPSAPPPPPKKFIPASPLENAPRSYGKRLEEFTPTPLSRPIGLPYPPQPGQNTGLDFRTMRQRRDDFVNIDKHLQRREELKNKISRPYFRDWGNLQWHKGKTFIAPPRLFRGDLSLYFPNLYGTTLLKDDGEPRDTTPTLQGRVSVVSVFSSRWADDQTKTFASRQHNPELAALLEAHTDRGAQAVRINVEEDAMKALLIRLFMGGLRREVGEPNWDKYFVVRKGVSDEIREAIGLLNSKVGYVYLVDAECRIRWAGSGLSEDHERESLVKSVQRLLEEGKKEEKGKKKEIL